MKKIIFAAMSLVASQAFAGEESAKQKQYAVPKCKQPALSLMLGKLSCKASGCNSGAAAAAAANPLLALAGAVGPNLSSLGDGLADMLTTSLQATGCFEIQNRDEMEAMKKEMETAGQKFEIRPANILVSGSITAVGMETKSTSFGGGFIPVIGAIGKNTKTANLSLDIKMMDIKKGGKIIEARTYEASNEDSSWSMWGGGLYRSGPGFGGFGGALSGLKGTPLEEVARVAIVEATIGITEKLAAANITERVPIVPKKD